MFFTNHWNNVKIGTKFNLFLIIFFLIGIFLSGVALSSVLNQRAENDIASKATILIQTINSVRNYTQERVNPLLEARLETESAFIPETVPAFSAREVFENFRQNQEYKNFFYKEAAPNPTNLRDKADQFEAKLVEYFRNHPQTKELSGFRNFAAGQIFYIARPVAIKEQKCLQCHSTLEVAPKSLLTTYGTEHGFGWKLNEIVATQIISVPAEEVFASASHSFALVMKVIIVIFAIIILLINFLLKKTVLKRIQKIAKTAQKVSTGDMDSDFQETCNDEIGALAKAFNRMKSSLEISMNLLNLQKK